MHASVGRKSCGAVSLSTNDAGLESSGGEGGIPVRCSVGSGGIEAVHLVQLANSLTRISSAALAVAPLLSTVHCARPPHVQCLGSRQLASTASAAATYRAQHSCIQ